MADNRLFLFVVRDEDHSGTDCFVGVATFEELYRKRGCKQARTQIGRLIKLAQDGVMRRVAGQKGLSEVLRIVRQDHLLDKKKRPVEREVRYININQVDIDQLRDIITTRSTRSGSRISQAPEAGIFFSKVEVWPTASRYSSLYFTRAVKYSEQTACFYFNFILTR